MNTHHGNRSANCSLPESPLDNPVWNALSSHQSALALGDALARRYPRDISPFAAISEHSELAFAALARLVAPRETVVLIGGEGPPPDEWKLLRQLHAIQMVCDQRVPEEPDSATLMSQLMHTDVPAMHELVELTHPGPFGSRTIELGTYLAIRHDVQLAAMAGERFHLDGYREISAVCTHPVFTKRGYARRLIARLVNQNLESGTIPFLHVMNDNVGAIALYESLGFTRRVAVQLFVIERC